MVLVEMSSGRPLAASSSVKRNPKGWTALIDSSERTRRLPGHSCILLTTYRGMQECFREHPDVYGAELNDEEADLPLDAETETPDESDPTQNATPALAVPLDSSSSPPESSPPPPPRSEESDHLGTQTQRAKAATEQVAKDHGIQDESEELVPKAAHDATTSQSGK